MRPGHRQADNPQNLRVPEVASLTGDLKTAMEKPLGETSFNDPPGDPVCRREHRRPRVATPRRGRRLHRFGFSEPFSARGFRFRSEH